MALHETYMQRCLHLAALGMGQVSPNPMVGSVLVYENRIIGEGYHQQYGHAHAEVNCINAVAENDKHMIENSTLYVSLEPCSHHGRTPPCTDLILSHKIKKVIIGCRDISAKVNGKGIRILEENGVEVIKDVLKDECIELNKRFFHFEKNKQSYVILKWAESMDGYIGKHGKTVKISNTLTDRFVHQWRADEDAIMAGYNTALTDNPQLNVRLANGKHPVRIVFDKQLSLTVTHHLFDNTQHTIIFNLIENKTQGKIEYIRIEEQDFLKQILTVLYEKKILSVIIEGGSTLLQQFIDAGIWNEARIIKSSHFLYEGIKGPALKNATFTVRSAIRNDIVYFHKNNSGI